MKKKYSRGKYSKLLAVGALATTVAATSLFSGCAPSHKNIKISSMKSGHGIISVDPSRNKIFHYLDKIGKHWVTIDPYEKIKKKGKNSSYFRNSLEIIPPEGSKRILTAKGLEKALDGAGCGLREIITTVSPDSKEKKIAGYICEGIDPDPLDGHSSWAEAKRLSERKIKAYIKYYKREEGGGDGNGGGNGGGGVGGGGGSGGSGGG